MIRKDFRPSFFTIHDEPVIWPEGDRVCNRLDVGGADETLHVAAFSS